MSRLSYQSRRDAREAWPLLASLLGAVLHGDDARSVEDDLEREIAGRSLSDRQAIASEWWGWNAEAGATDDIRFAIEALDEGIAFARADQARTFMNNIYDRLIVSIRREAGKDWKP